MYIGVIEGIGFCYCLLIEDKIYCFVEKNFYQIFIELEGLIMYEFYFNGIFISLLFDVQLDLVYFICGMEQVYILWLGYVIEYDYFDFWDLCYFLEIKFIQGLFFVG